MSAPPKNKGSPRLRVTPKKKYQHDDFSAARDRCFTCGTKIDYERRGYSVATNVEHAFKALICVECNDELRQLNKGFFGSSFYTRRMETVAERLSYGEPCHFDGVMLMGEKQGGGT